MVQVDELRIFIPYESMFKRLNYTAPLSESRLNFRMLNELDLSIRQKIPPSSSHISNKSEAIHPVSHSLPPRITSPQ